MVLLFYTTSEVYTIFGIVSKMIWQISIREGMKAAEQRMKELQKLPCHGDGSL